MEIIGFGGTAASGKSTAARMLREASGSQKAMHFEFSDPIMSIGASCLNSMTERDFVFNQDVARKVLCDELRQYATYDEGRLLEDIPELPHDYVRRMGDGPPIPLTQENKALHRPLLEWIGKSALVLVSPTIWGDILNSDIDDAKDEGADLVTIGGIRTVANSDFIHGLGGKTVRIVRPRSISHANPTEYQLNEWQADYVANNGGSIEDLRRNIVAVWDSIVESNRRK